MLELAEKIIDMTGSFSTLKFLPLPQDDPKQRKPDISMAREILGWQPVTDMRRGVEKTVAYFDQLLQRKRVQ